MTASVGLATAARAGIAVVLAVLSAVPAVFVHPLLWPLPLVAVTCAALLLALRPGWPRVAYALAWGAVVLAFTLGRSEGDLVVQQGLAANLLFTLALVWLIVALVTVSARSTGVHGDDPVARSARHSESGSCPT